MKLKLDAGGHVVVQDGKPVYTHDDGQDRPFDAPQAVTKISQLNGEAQGHRVAKEAAEAALQKFEGIADPDKARAALATLANLDDKKLIDAGEVEKIKAAAIASVEAKYKPVVTENEKLKTDLYGEKIGGAFARSKFISEKIAVPLDMVQAAFGSAFKIEDGKVIATGPDGKQIYSKTRHGEPADFEEALEQLVDAYPHKATILKGPIKPGAGTEHSGPGAAPDLSKLSPTDRMTAAREAQA